MPLFFVINRNFKVFKLLVLAPACVGIVVPEE